MILSKIFPLPLKDYVKNILSTMPPHGVRLIIYDQLNPHYAKYYKKEEAKTLLKKAGFVDIRICQRFGYSWTVHARKP